MLNTIKDTPYTLAEITPIAQRTLATQVAPSERAGVENDTPLAWLNALSPLLLATGKGEVMPDSVRFRQIDNLLSRYQDIPVDTLPGIANTLDAIRAANSAVESETVDISQSKALLDARYQATAVNLEKINTILRDSKLRAKAASGAFSATVESVSPDKASGSMEQIQPDSKNHAEYGKTLTTESASISTSSSYAELWERIAIAIGSINTNYVDFYANLMQKYTKMYETYNNTVQKAASEAVNSASDANNVNFNRAKMREGYANFKYEVEKMDLGAVKGWGNLSNEQRENMKSSLKPAFQIDAGGGIKFNLDQFNELTWNGFTFGPDKEDVLTTRYQAWLASFNALGSALQSNMQSFAQTYGQSNNTFANLNKVLSGVINSLGDSAKDVFKSLS